MKKLLLVITLFVYFTVSPAWIAEAEQPRIQPLFDNGEVEQKTISILLLEKLKQLPKVEEIEEMTVECVGCEKIIKRPFVVPQRHYTTILETFGEPELLINMTVGHDEWGCVRIVTKKGPVHHIIWYWTGKTPLIYSLYGIPCMRKTTEGEKIVAESMNLNGKVQAIYNEVSMADEAN